MLLSVEEYRRLKRREQQALHVEELSDADLEAIGQAEVPPGFRGLDDELVDH